MKPQRRWPWVWIVCLVGSCAIFFWDTRAKIHHIDYLSTIGAEGENRADSVNDSAQRNTALTSNNSLPLPDQLSASYQWLAQTEQMLNRGEAKVRHIDYENAPFGRTVRTPSPYRWWLGFLAWCEHSIKGSPASTLVEKAALWADPILLGILIVGAVILASKYFGVLSAAIVSIGFISLFPFVTGFLPGEPDDRGLAEVFAIASVMLLSVALVAGSGNEKSRRRWFVLAGIAGGLDLWVKVPVGLPVLAGIFGSGLFLSLFASRGSREVAATPVLPWRAWSYAGAATTLVASLIEYTPAELRTADLSFVHPLHALAWLGAGEFLVQVYLWRQSKALFGSAKHIVLLAASLVAVAVVPAALFGQHGAAVFIIDGMGSHLTRLSDGIVAKNLAFWLGAQGPSIWWLLTFAPLALLIPALGVLMNSQTAKPVRTAVAISLGPALVALMIACAKLSWWQTADALLLVSLAVAAVGIPSRVIESKTRIRWTIIAFLSLVPGLVYSVRAIRPSKVDTVNQTEVQDLILRDLARWIVQHSDPGTVTVLAPPSASTALSYYGAFRGLGALSEENKDGVAAIVRIMSSRSVSETKEVVNHRKITHIVLLSWDSFFDECARAASGQIEGTFRDRLNFTTLPLWLRPLAYPLPSIPGFEDQSVTVFEVVDERDEATALSDIALYFLETGNMEQARAAAAGLSRFPIDAGAWVTRAQVAAAVGDDVELAKAIKVLQARLAARVQPLISWNRRVDLAVVLARANLETLAKKELELCVEHIDDSKIRSLSPGSVYRLLVMCRGFDVSIPSAQRSLALNLAPTGLRDRLK